HADNATQLFALCLHDALPISMRCYWISLGELSRLIEILKREGIHQVVMAGQIKHANIFSSIRPDWRLLKMLAGLPRKNTDALIGDRKSTRLNSSHVSISYAVF